MSIDSIGIDSEGVKSTLQRARQEAARVIIGQDDALLKALIVILTRSHALIEGVPGVAKTLLVKTLARVLGTEFGRVQFTPDLMPADITGTNVFNMKLNEFVLARGPVFTTFLLADEINRAPAKTQSALLQAMQERFVTIDRETHPLPEDFTVFATQNPVEYEGTYPLPEAQKDRFMIKISMGYPSLEEESALASRMLGQNSPESALAQTGPEAVKPVLGQGELSKLRSAIGQITVKEELASYAVNIIRASRTFESVLVGGSPRATQALVLSARAHAALQERDFVTPDDIKAMAEPVLGHRLILRPEYEIEGLGPEEVVNEILRKVKVPR